MTDTLNPKADNKVTLVIRSAVSTWTVRVYDFQVGRITDAFHAGRAFNVTVSEGDAWCSKEKVVHFNSNQLVAIEVTDD